MYSFSADVSCSSNLLVTFLSAAKTMPSLDRIPIAVPACDIASSAYSTWYNRPSGENMVVCKLHFSYLGFFENGKLEWATLESYLRDIMRL